MSHPLLVFVGLGAICHVVNLFGRLLVARLVGAKVKKVGLFIGPTLWKCRIKEVDWEIGMLPFGNSVAFEDEEKDSGQFALLPLWKRLAVMASGSVTLAILACCCLGPVHGILSIWRGFDQILQGGYSPSRIGRPLVHAFFGFLRSHPFMAGLGIVAAKFAAMNIYPIPPFDGGMMLLALLERKPKNSTNSPEV